MKKIIASGPVIIEEGKLLVIKDNKDDFYKIPGGTLKEKESLEECALRELKEETNFEGELNEKLSTKNLTKNPQTLEEMKIELHHYSAKIKNFKNDFEDFTHNNHKIKWLNIKEIKENKHNVAPNIKFLIEKGEIN